MNYDRDIALVKAGLEAAAKVSAHCECAYDIRALDPVAIAAGVEQPIACWDGSGCRRASLEEELAALRAEVDRLAACKFPDSQSIVVTLPDGERLACAAEVGAEIERLRRTDVQFAVPDGKYPNDLFFITNSKNQIICLLCWTGEGWITKDEIFRVELRDV